MSELNIYQRLSNIQNELVVTKNQRNTFGNYNFRSAEDILEAVKPICKKHETVLILSDNIILVGERNYVEATATLHDLSCGAISVTASAREALIQKGMQDAQITGSSSSYARKYALGGLFNLDDNKDPDATNKHDKGDKDEPKGNSGAKITLHQTEQIQNFIKEGKVNSDKMKSFFNVKNVEGLNYKQAEEVIASGNSND